MSYASDSQIKGAGDLVAKITKVTKIDLAVKKVTQTMGIKDCGCEARRELLNNIIPFKNAERS
jgi:glycerol dehydrogenase-like iron-containing ADH family enzyme